MVETLPYGDEQGEREHDEHDHDDAAADQAPAA